MTPTDYSSFFIGVLSSLVATFLVWALVVIQEREALKSAEGLWLEIIPGQQERPYSLGEFSFSFLTKRYQYNGINYSIDGTPHYEWRSLKAYFDKDRGKLFYLYEVSMYGSHEVNNHGFGLVVLKRHGRTGRLAATSGYFVDAEKNGTVPQNIRFVRAEDVARRINFLLNADDPESRSKFIASLAKSDWKP